MRRSVFQLPFLTLLVLAIFTSCGHSEAPKIPAIDLNAKVGDSSLLELSRLYEDALDQFTRRSICLRAIDEGKLRPGIPLESVDQIFGTHFAPDSRPTETKLMHTGVIHFFPDYPQPPATLGSKTEARAYVGWFLVVEYDERNILQNYFLSNISKGRSHGEPGIKPSSLDELKQAYAAANTESGRRDVCIRAIDEGYIRTLTPVSTLDTIFGSQLALNLPKRRDHDQTSEISFAPANPIGVNAGQRGWFLAVSYDYEGSIQDYYLSNVHNPPSSKQ
ncbi:MAG TPA: hypothetical protein VN643_27205 [Pyrinomonadaceae bacterium]|nr:hypothetical protein [Pyrinomonadaceae bacterium]